MVKNLMYESTDTAVADDIIAKKAEQWSLAFAFDGDMIWRYSGKNIQRIPDIGFKIHISATQVNCLEVLNLVIPFLLERKIPFKHVGSVKLLLRLNYGDFGYTQVGKFITIYPFNPQHAVELSLALHERLKQFQGPRIPSDRQVVPFSIVHYRYGSLRSVSQNASKNEEYKDEYFDSRHPSQSVPEGIEDPFAVTRNRQAKKSGKSALIGEKYLIIQTLQQKAKGGVYRALQFEELFYAKGKTQKRFVEKVIIKEARYLMELDQHNNDAVTRLKLQEKLQLQFKCQNLVPENKDRFEVNGNYYLVMQDLGDVTLKSPAIPAEDLSSCESECCKITFRKLFSLFSLTFNELFLFPPGIAVKSLLLRRPKVSTEYFLSLIKKIINKLQYLQACNYFCFDISLSNFVVWNDEPYLVDLEYVTEKEYKPHEGVEYGTPGFYPRDSYVDKYAKDSSQKALLRDMFGIGAILLAFFQKRWFDSLKEKDVLKKQDWGASSFIQQQPFQIRKILKKAFLLEQPYQNWQFLQKDIDQLVVHK